MVDTVFANAGSGTLAPLGAITEKQYHDTFDTNVKGVIFTVQKALPLAASSWQVSGNRDSAHAGRIRSTAAREQWLSTSDGATRIAVGMVCAPAQTTAPRAWPRYWCHTPATGVLRHFAAGKSLRSMNVRDSIGA
jgi:NAD(P)-dependent dehydrogenase (short-subunit alcohol dehydrogenase family)